MVVCVSAQSQSNKPNQPDEKVLISEWVDGNYLVRRYKMMRNDSEAKYDIHYSVSASKLSDLTAGNAAEIADIDKMMAALKSDTTKHIQYITITGYASPDGNAQSNKVLAMSRAQKFKDWLDSRFALAAQYKVDVISDVEQWNDCIAAVESSSISDKSGVLTVLNSAMNESQKEQKLKAMPQVWSVFRTQILPAMRRVDMTVYYNTDTYVEVRTLIEKPAMDPEPVVATQKYCCDGAVMEDEIIGIIVDMRDGRRNH